MKILKIFEEKLRYRNYSERSITLYVSYLSSFMKYENIKDPYQVTTSKIINFLEKKTYTSKSQQNQYIGCLKLFAKYILNKKYMHLSKIERPKSEKKLPKVDGEYIKSQLYKITNLKHKTILTLTYSVGLRLKKITNYSLYKLIYNRNFILLKMQQFSKLKPKDEFSEPKDQVLFDNEYVKVIDYEGWSILKEKDLVVCIPYFIETNQFLIRYEYIPTYKYVEGQEYHITVLSGGIEKGETVDKALLRELEEEAGIVLKEDYKFEDIKPLFINKGHTNKYHPFIIPLNERDYHEIVPTTDGSNAEKMSKSVRVDVKYIDSLNTTDLITDYMLLKLKQYLNL